MKIELVLAEDGPPFWFLGEPRDLIVSLTLEEPGPKEVDFNSLGDHERARIIQDVQLEKIVCHTPIETLKEFYFRKQVPAVPNQAAEEYLQQKERHQQAQRVLKQAEAHKKKQQRYQDRLASFAKYSIRALKAALKDENDLGLLRTIREQELTRKQPRKSVIIFLQEKIKRIQLDVVKEIERNQNPNAKLPNPDARDLQSKTFLSDVVESEKQEVQFSDDDLARLASGDEF